MVGSSKMKQSCEITTARDKGQVSNAKWIFYVFYKDQMCIIILDTTSILHNIPTARIL